MSKVMFDLKDCQINDRGEVLVKYDTLVTRIRCGEPIDGLVGLPHDDIEVYNQRNPDRPILTAEDTGETDLPSLRSYRFDLPEPYLNLDIGQYLAERLFERFQCAPEPYIERLLIEWEMMQQRGMESFLRTLIYVAETFTANGVVNGIGRGSGCASLVLFLIGIHMVDPILYDIPIEEFLR